MVKFIDKTTLLQCRNCNKIYDAFNLASNYMFTWSYLRPLPPIRLIDKYDKCIKCGCSDLDILKNLKIYII